MTVTGAVGGWMPHSAGAQVNMLNGNFGEVLVRSQRLYAQTRGASGNEDVKNPHEYYGLHE